MALQATPARHRFLSVEPLLEDLGALDLGGIHWVIVGGESGPGARPMRPAWVRSIHAACKAHEALFFFKQWGGTNKKSAGRLLDGQEYGAMPELKREPVLPTKKRRALIARVDDRAKVFEPLIHIGRRDRRDRQAAPSGDRISLSPAQLGLFGGSS